MKDSFEQVTNFWPVVKISIHVRPGDCEPPRYSRKVEGSTLAFSIARIAAKTSVTGTFLVFAAVFKMATCSDTSTGPLGMGPSISSTETEESAPVSAALLDACHDLSHVDQIHTVSMYSFD